MRLKNYFSSEVLSARQLAGIALPILWEQIFFTLLSLLSVWMMVMDGERSLSVVNMMTVINQVFLSICLGLVTGGTVVVAQNIGAGRHRMAGKATAQTMALALGVTVVLGGLLLLLRRQVVGYLLEGAEQEIVSLAQVYFTGFCLSFPLYALYQSFAGCMRGRGRTGAALRLTLSVNLTELGLTALFVLGLGMGVQGVTLSMALSRLGGAAVAAAYLLRHRQELELRPADFLRPDAGVLRGIVVIALPLALEQFFFNSGKAMSQRFIAGYGTAHMAATGVVNAVYNVIHIPQATMTAVSVTVVGMCVGKGLPDLGGRYIRRFRNTITATLLLLLPLLLPLSWALVQGYNLSPEAQRLTYLCLGVILVFAPALQGGSFQVPAGLRAGGDAVYVSAGSLCSMWLCRVTLSYVFTRILPWGVVGMNLAMGLEWALRTLLYGLRLRSGKWHRHRLLAAE